MKARRGGRGDVVVFIDCGRFDDSFVSDFRFRPNLMWNSIRSLFL